MAISRAQELKQLIPGLHALFGQDYKTYAEEHKEIFVTEKSNRSFEEELKLSNFGAALEKAEGAAVSYDEAQEAYASRYNHKTIALGFAITEEAMEDNLYASVGKRYVKALARSMAHTKQVMAANILNNGFDGTVAAYRGGDGRSLFGFNSAGSRTGHPLVGGGVNQNSLTTPADLNETSLEASVIQISNWTDERGLLIAAKPKKLIIPTDLMFVAERLMSTTLRTSLSAVTTFAPNDINAIKSMGVIPQGFAVNHYLTDADAWFLTTDVPDGLKHFVRVAMQTKTDGDFDTGNMKYKARERYSFGWSDPLGIFGSEGA